MKVIFTYGISGSGKSTWTRNFIQSNPNYIRINRDAIRETLIPDHINNWYNRPDREQLEKLVSSIEYDLTDIAYIHDKDIVIDSTNLDKKRLEAFLVYLKKHHDEVDISIKIFECRLRIAQNRVYRRDYAGETFDDDEYFDLANKPQVAYIEKQYNKFQGNLPWIKSLPYNII